MGLLYATFILITSLFISQLVHTNIDKLEGKPLFSLVRPYLEDKGYLLASIMYILLIIF
jgi:hypothetical protein